MCEDNMNSQPQGTSDVNSSTNWEKVATDLLPLDGSAYLLAVDYFSRYPEVIKLTSTTSKAVISSLNATSLATVFL